MTATIQPPPENLVIYEVEGLYPGEVQTAFGPGFLGFWVEGGYTFFFFDQEAGLNMGRLLAGQKNLALRYVHRLKYSEWQDGAGFHPFRVGPLTVFPAWEDPPTESHTGLIRLDPGLAFGFGGHPTTKACLEFLVRVYREDRPSWVLDLGAGTGILALAAARLGAQKVLAVDYSHLAAETARRNVGLNHLSETVEVIHGLAEDNLNFFPAQLVCCNLHHAVQKEILAKGGFSGRRWLILSGLFHDQAEKIEEALKADDYRLLDRIRDERWTTLLWQAQSP